MEIAWILVVLCVMVSWTDVRRRRIPNRTLSVGLLLIGGIAAVSWPKELWLAHLACGVGVAVIFGATAWFWPDRLGMGDVKLLGVLGFALGLPPFVSILTVTCFLILLFALPLLTVKRMKGGSSLPFAPFVTFGLLYYLVSI